MILPVGPTAGDQELRIRDEVGRRHHHRSQPVGPVRADGEASGMRAVRWQRPTSRAGGGASAASDPASYPDRPAVERIDTHSASVFLAGSRAYKVKRAIRYLVPRLLDAGVAPPSLRDGAAPEPAHGAAPLRDVVPVTRAGTGQLAFGGEGTPVEWVLVMERFPQEQLLDRLATAGAISRAWSRSQVADRIAEFHAAAAPRRHRGGADAMRAVVRRQHAGFRGRGTADRCGRGAGRDRRM